MCDFVILCFFVIVCDRACDGACDSVFLRSCEYRFLSVIVSYRERLCASERVFRLRVIACELRIVASLHAFCMLLCDRVLSRVLVCGIGRVIACVCVRFRLISCEFL